MRIECCLCDSLGTIYTKYVNESDIVYLDSYCERHKDRMEFTLETEITKDEYMLLLAMKKL